eukprot:CAMPEP_0179415520 /NCGR_PEP_ID=MMETSP0799-20121207/6277_1 /TAXON_ID=46947 /ORGANISM="Geminigera cryophila, Strain CCMP2564" /LENGTH=70 /DNA_ID=CAMNT_0021188267 /DNA_START=784 /DNA_END=993 /DNA_ORIENTATION=+
MNGQVIRVGCVKDVDDGNHADDALSTVCEAIAKPTRPLSFCTFATQPFRVSDTLIYVVACLPEQVGHVAL